MTSPSPRTLRVRVNFLPPEGVEVDRELDDLGQVTYDAGEPLPEWALTILEDAGQTHYLEPETEA